MPFTHPTRIRPGKLNRATPTPFDAANLKNQLANVGLNCNELSDNLLHQYVTEVESQLDDGHTEVFAIKAPPESLNHLSSHPSRLASMLAEDEAEDEAEEASVTSLAASIPTLVDAATGNWVPDNEAEGYGPNLQVMVFPSHFNWLYDNRGSNGFTGQKNSPPASTGYFQNAEAIKKMFVQTALTASSTLIKGLNKDAMKASLTNAIQPVRDDNISNYERSDSRAIFLVDNYNPSTGDADGIGVVVVRWTLRIHDYKRKSKDGGDTHDTYLKVDAESVLYSDPGLLCQHYYSVLDHFGIQRDTAPSCRT